MDAAAVRNLTEHAIRSTLDSYRLLNGETNDAEEVTALGPGVHLETEVYRSYDATYQVSVSVERTRRIGEDRDAYIPTVRTTIVNLVSDYVDDNGIDWRDTFAVFELSQEDALDLCGYREVSGTFTFEDVTLAVPEGMDEDRLPDIMLSDSGITARNEDTSFDPD